MNLRVAALEFNKVIDENNGCIQTTNDRDSKMHLGNSSGSTCVQIGKSNSICVHFQHLLLAR